MLPRATIHDVHTLTRLRDPASATVYGPWAHWMSRRSPGATARSALATLRRDVEDRAGADAATAVVDRIEEFLTRRAGPGAGRDGGVALFATPRALSGFALPVAPDPVVHVDDRFLVTPLAASAAAQVTVVVVTVSEAAVRAVRVEPPPAGPTVVAGLPESFLAHARLDVTGDRNALARLRIATDDSERLTAYLRSVESALAPLRHRRRTIVVVASAEPLATLHRDLAERHHLATRWITGNHDDTSPETLADLARPLWTEERDLLQLAQLERLREYPDRSCVTDDRERIAESAEIGQVEVLFLDRGAIARLGSTREASDGLERATRAALATGAHLVDAPRGSLPGGAAVAAILRSPTRVPHRNSTLAAR